MSSQRFRTQRLGGRAAAGISVPSEVVETLGGGRRPPVRVTASTPHGSYAYRSTVAPMGGLLTVSVSAEDLADALSQDAERPETRAHRVEQATTMLHQGKNR